MKRKKIKNYLEKFQLSEKYTKYDLKQNIKEKDDIYNSKNHPQREENKKTK